MQETILIQFIFSTV